MAKVLNTTAGTHIFPGFRVKPGENEIPDADWNAQLARETAAGFERLAWYVETGAFVVDLGRSDSHENETSSSAEPDHFEAEDAPETAETGYPPQPSVTEYLDLSTREARSVIAECDDAPALSAWLSEETRKTVSKYLEARLQKLGK